VGEGGGLRPPTAADGRRGPGRKPGTTGVEQISPGTAAPRFLVPEDEDQQRVFFSMVTEMSCAKRVAEALDRIRHRRITD
jgi:hypothetical protein